MAKTSTDPMSRQDLHAPQLTGQLAHGGLPAGTSAQNIYDQPPTRTGVAIGSRIVTLDGVLPIEFLAPGDRIITRTGVKALRKITAQKISGEMIRVNLGALGKESSEQAPLLQPGTMVHIRDWRAQALCGKPQALVPADRLIDGEFITRERVGRKTVFTLEFDSAEVIYADGVELGCDALRP